LRHTYLKKEFPAGNPIASALVIIAGALVIGISIVLGVVAFVALSAVILVSAAIIGLRVWWLQRKLGRRAQAANGAAGQTAPRGVIEGEFKVVHKDRDEA